jgi:hypothetical protein
MPLSYPAILLLHTYNVLPSKSTETSVYQTWSSSNVTKPISGRMFVQEAHQTTPLLSIYSYLTHVQKYLTTECTTRKKEEPLRTYLSSPYHGVEQCIPCNHSHLWISQSSHHGNAYSCFHPASHIWFLTVQILPNPIIAPHQKMNIEEKSYWSRSMWLKMLVHL